MKTKTKKIIISILVVGQLSVPLFAFAQLGIIANSPATPVWVNTAINPVTDSIPLAAIAAASAANQACSVTEQGFAAADTGLQLGFGGLSLISGGASLQAQLTAKIAKIEGFIACRQAVLATLQGIPAIDTLVGQQKQTVSNSASSAIDALKLKEDSVKAQLASAQQGFWKTLVLNILIQTSKGVADALVTKLVDNYKIYNIKQYADSVATLMYDNQYLRDNFPGGLGQGMARTILNQPQFRYTIQPGIYVAADNALGFAPGSLSPSDPNFYQKMALVGSSSANPYFIQASYVSGVDLAHAQALNQANALIAQSQGYKTPVNCAGSLTQQQQIDAQTVAASARLADRQNLLNSLQAAQAAGQNISQSDLAKAQADYNSALIAWQNIPSTVAGLNSTVGTNSLSANLTSGSNTEGALAITMCEAISSPANLINKGIDQAFNAAGTNLSQYNNNNLPGYISLIGQVASQIGSSLVFGGARGAAGAALVNEGSLAAGATSAINQTLAANAASSTINSITFVAENTGQNNTYNLNWDVTALSGADHVTIAGDGVQSAIAKLPASGATSIVTSKGGNYTLSVYDSSNSLLATRSIYINVSSTQPTFSYNTNAQVLGAKTSTPNVITRGTGLQLRGP